jgi:hypothetical protein
VGEQAMPDLRSVLLASVEHGDLAQLVVMLRTARGS